MWRSFVLGALSGVIVLVAITAAGIWFALSRTSDIATGEAASLAQIEFTGLYNPERIEAGRARLALEDPRIIQRFLSGGTFGGKASRLAGLHMFSRAEDVTADIRSKTERIEVAPGSWLVRFPIVNAAFFETEEGVVVVDTGMAAAGPVLLEQIREVTDAPISAIIITHGHVDHLTGLWAFEAAGELPDTVIGHQDIVSRIERYGVLRGSIAKYMSQPVGEVPGSSEDVVLPTMFFDGQTVVDYGAADDMFKIVPHRGETDDQAYVWLPDRKVLVTADYYQGFLPNLGNGKRVQRFGTEWIAALREMADLGAEVMLPMHGAPITGAEDIRESLTLLADALEHIESEVIAGLNAGLRKDEIIASITWPARFANDPRLATYYVTPRDVAKMYIKQWTGWWDDQPAHWTPSSLEAQARQVVALAGGLEPFLAEAALVAKTDIAMASHMADWAFYASPDDRRAQDFAIETYKSRLLDPRVSEQEALAYFDHIALIRGMQLEVR